MNNINFIEKSKIIHDDKFDYSLVNYVKRRVRVKIICKIHGVFDQTPDKHLNGRGCPNCAKTKKLDTIEFIKKASIVHKNFYDYSKVNYVDAKTLVYIICPLHGEFLQIPPSHLNGHGCSICGVKRNNFIESASIKYHNYYDYSATKYKNSFTKVKIICPRHGEFEQFPQSHIETGCVLCQREQSFKDKCKKIHNDKYDYSLVDYVDQSTKIKIICPDHGEFMQPPKLHIRGNGCKKCSDDRKKLNLEIFIKRSVKTHGDKYDYSLVDYVGANDKIKIICPIHGEFMQRPSEHYHKGCDMCGGSANLTTNDFVEKSKKIHGNVYDYSLVDYVSRDVKVKIICKEHGIFYQKAGVHLDGRGCQMCICSKSEIKISKYLDDNKIECIKQKRFSDCKNMLPLPFDFYLPFYNICIEYDGKQHYNPVDRFGGVNGLAKRKFLDKIKTDYCKDKNIILIRIKYTDNIFSTLNNKLHESGVIF